MSEQGHNLEDKLFDIEALEYSLEESPTSSTSSSFSNIPVGYPRQWVGQRART